MSAKLTRREYTNQFRSEKTSWLLGNVGDKISLELDFEINVATTSSFSNQFESNGVDTITQNVGNFNSDGFFAGSFIGWSTTVSIGGGSPVAYVGTGTITVLTPTSMIVSVSGGTFPPAYDYPVNSSNVKNTELLIFSGDNVEGVVLNYNLIANSDISGASLNSLIDGTTPTFKADNIDPTDTVTVVPMTTLGFTSGSTVLNASIVGGGVVGIVQKFTVTIEFLIGPLFLDLADLQNMVAPSPYFDVESITDVFKLTFLPQLNNPNVSITTDSTSTALKGNVGWFNENFDGNPAIYKNVGTTYTDTNGSTISSILQDGVTNFRISINQTNNSATSKYKFGFAFVPFDQTLIANNNEFNYKNIIYNGLGTGVLNQSTPQTTFAGNTNSFGAKMDVRFDSITNVSNTVTIAGQFQPNTLFNDYINTINTSDGNFVVWISCADESLASNVSDRVSILCGFDSFIKEPISFVLGDVNIDFLNHAQGITNVGSLTYNGTAEDEILTQSLMFLDTAKNESVDSVSFIIEGFNTLTGATFVADQYDVNTTSFPVDASKVQQINFNATRGFQMVAGLNKNIVELVRDVSSDVGTKKAYFMRFAMRFRWEDWVQNQNVPNDLVDPTEQFDGKNQFYPSKDTFSNDWRLRFSVQTELNTGGVLVNTKNSSNVFVANYEESTVWDGEITHFNEAGTTNLFTGVNSDNVRTNAILDNASTLIQADFDLQNLASDVGSIADYYGVIRIEVYQEGGQKGIEMLSTVLDNKNEILIPITGQTKCKITKISSTKIRLEGLIDFNYLDLTKSNYKTSARIGYKNLAVPGIYGSQYGPQYA